MKITNFTYFTLFISFFELFFCIIYTSALSYTLINIKHLENRLAWSFIAMCFSVALYTFLAFFGISIDYPDSVGVVLSSFASIPAFLSFIFYIKVLKSHLDLHEDRFIFFVEKFSVFIILIYIIFFTFQVTGIIGTPAVSDVTNIFLKKMLGAYTFPLPMRVNSLFQLLIMLASFIYLFVVVKEEYPREKLIKFGLILTLTIFPVEVLLEYIPFVFPLLGVVYLPETLRIWQVISLSIKKDTHSSMMHVMQKSSLLTFQTVMMSFMSDYRQRLLGQGLDRITEDGIKRKLHAYEEICYGHNERKIIFAHTIMDKSKSFFKSDFFENEITLNIRVNNFLKLYIKEAHFFILINTLLIDSITKKSKVIDLYMAQGQDDLILRVTDDGVMAKMMKSGNELFIVNEIVNFYYGRFIQTTIGEETVKEVRFPLKNVL